MLEKSKLIIVPVAIGGIIWLVLKSLKTFKKKKVNINELEIEKSTNVKNTFINNEKNDKIKYINVPFFKGVYLMKYNKSTIIKSEIASGARYFNN